MSKMNLKIVVSILLVFVNFDPSFGQEISCEYRIESSFGYLCIISIENPNGLNNFTEIKGTHLAGKNDDDVRYIYGYAQSSLNIPSIICDKFKFITRISLSSSGIEKIDEYSFKNCKNLRSLGIDTNNITKVDEKSFIQNLELQTLFMNSNPLSELPENVFANQHKLNNLVLYSNEFSDLPKNIFKSLINLNELWFRQNQLKSLRVEWFENLENIKTLYLEANQIEELPKNVFSSLKNLREIQLGNNTLKVIHSDSFGVLPNLTNVFIGNNQINAIDERFVDNTGVELLDMRGNLCANFIIYDSSSSKYQIRNALQTCFDNYKALFPGMNVVEIFFTKYFIFFNCYLNRNNDKSTRMCRWKFR